MVYRVSAIEPSHLLYVVLDCLYLCLCLRFPDASPLPPCPPPLFDSQLDEGRLRIGCRARACLKVFQFPFHEKKSQEAGCMRKSW